MKQFKVTFYPEGREVVINSNQTLLDAASQAGIYINSICAGEGVCGKCKLIVREGKVFTPPTHLLTRLELQRSYVLACQTMLNSDVEVELPLETRLEEVQILTEGEKKRKFLDLFALVEKVESQEKLEKEFIYKLNPLVKKFYLEIPKPSLDDNLSYLQRIYREIKKREDYPILQTGLFNLKKLPELLNDANWNVTVTLGERNGTVELVQIETGNTTLKNFGVAIDIGTTTVAATLLDLNTARVIDTKANYNTQVSFGEDVISRIIYAEESEGLKKLNQAVVDNINGLITSLALENNVKLNDINIVMCAGNTTMSHLLIGLTPTSIRKEPYVPVVNFLPTLRASEIGIKINPRGLLANLPSVSSYVGGDITAGVLASGMNKDSDISILIDIGTNGEVVLGNNEWLVGCSCSAGPAFEGGGVKCGMRASRGAIQEVRINLKENQIQYKTIGDVKPRGICGSGLIDLMAEMLKEGIINRAGKINLELNQPRIRKTDQGVEFVIIFDKETEINQDIIITEDDIMNLIRSKAAMYVGTDFLLKKIGLSFNEIKNFYIAGGFGNYLNIKNSILIGLLPDISLDIFKFIGNSSLTGAKIALLSQEALEEAHKISQKLTNFELSIEANFMNEYTSALFLPHTDLRLFPNVSKKLNWSV
ncbi:MAG: DUF4445 domain-containing protein [Armatimonadetes bacterium]|nr:DUF4445 domain-containing protein [Armatimonadota bacterium]